MSEHWRCCDKHQLLPDAKIAEDVVQDIVRVDVTKDRPQFVECGADLHGDQFIAVIRLGRDEGVIQ